MSALVAKVFVTSLILSSKFCYTIKFKMSKKTNSIKYLIFNIFDLSVKRRFSDSVTSISYFIFNFSIFFQFQVSGLLFSISVAFVLCLALVTKSVVQVLFIFSISITFVLKALC